MSSLDEYDKHQKSDERWAKYFWIAIAILGIGIWLLVSVV